MDAEAMLDAMWQALYDDGLFPPAPVGAFGPYPAMAVGRGEFSDWVPAPAGPLWVELAARTRPPEEVRVQGDVITLRWPEPDALQWLFEALTLAGPNPPAVAGSVSESGATVVATPEDLRLLALHFRMG